MFLTQEFILLCQATKEAQGGPSGRQASLVHNPFQLVSRQKQKDLNLQKKLQMYFHQRKSHCTPGKCPCVYPIKGKGGR